MSVQPANIPSLRKKPTKKTELRGKRSNMSLGGLAAETGERKGCYARQLRRQSLHALPRQGDANILDHSRKKKSYAIRNNAGGG